MRHNLYMQIVPRIRNGGQQRAYNRAEDEELRYWRVGEARGDHACVAFAVAVAAVRLSEGK